jgi:uncharacterized membrane protein
MSGVAPPSPRDGGGRARGSTRWADRVAAAASVVTLAGMIATPLMRRGERGRRIASTLVVGGLWTTTTAVSARRWGATRAGVAAAAVGVTTAVVERVGTRTGLPFGRYRYSSALRPQVAGVPALVPLAWFAMAVPAREAAHRALRHHSDLPRRLAVGSAALTAWDLFLDPQMVGEGYWQWQRRGRYRGIPLTNYLGWLLTGCGVMAMLEVLLPTPRGDDEDDGVAAGALVAEYAVMATMETLGFAAFFKDRLVAAVGGAAMLPFAVLSVKELSATSQ